MAFYVVGLNAKTHSVEEREKYAFLDKVLINRNKKLIESCIVDEILTISTCNRFEIYFFTKHSSEKVISHLFNNNPPKKLYILKDFKASYHLCQVASGLDSQILGENEVLGQVKKAYLLAQQSDLTKKWLNKIFQKAIYVGKRVRTLTGISKCSLSTGGIIIDKIKHHFDDLSKINVLLIGAGDISRSVAMSLYKKDVRNIMISNRGHETGTLLAEEMNSSYIPIDRLYDSMRSADVIISSTSAPHYILTREHETSFNNGSKKVIVDLAVPRDIEPEISSYDNISLYNIDDISTISSLNKVKRKKEVKKANQIIAMENCNLCLSLKIEDNLCPANSGLYDFRQVYKTLKKSTII